MAEVLALVNQDSGKAYVNECLSHLFTLIRAGYFRLVDEYSMSSTLLCDMAAAEGRMRSGARAIACCAFACPQRHRAPRALGPRPPPPTAP